MRKVSRLLLCCKAQRSLCTAAPTPTTPTPQTYAGLSEQSFIALTEKTCPFVRDVLKAKVTSLSRGKLSMVLPFQDIFVGNPLTKALHGGVTAAMLDHVGGFAAWSKISDPKQLISTADLRIDYIAPAPCEDMLVEGVVVSFGKSLIRADITCYSGKNKKVIAIGRGLYSLYKAPSSAPTLDIAGLAGIAK